MPFKSGAQLRAAFGGYLGSEMKAKAPEFAAATPDIKGLPTHVPKPKDAGLSIKDRLVASLKGGR